MTTMYYEARENAKRDCCIELCPAGAGGAFMATEPHPLPITSSSIFVRRKQSSASSGLHTTGSFSLKEVFGTIGTPVNARNAGGYSLGGPILP